jgi:prepilin-type N-terminal cleavage/methylation domain-containing protein
MRRPTSRRGFTLVEVLISASLAGIVMTAVLSSFVFMGRSMSRLSSYQSLETESRRALAYLQKDFTLAQKIKAGTAPTAAAVTLVLPAGEVAYTYDSATKRLRRQATFGGNPDLYLLKTASSECTAFSFDYYTTTDGAPTDQVTPANYVPYSIKQIRVRFTVESPSSWTTETRTRYEAASARVLFRNRTAPDGS